MENKMDLDNINKKFKEVIDLIGDNPSYDMEEVVRISFKIKLHRAVNRSSFHDHYKYYLSEVHKLMKKKKINFLGYFYKESGDPADVVFIRNPLNKHSLIQIKKGGCGLCQIFMYENKDSIYMEYTDLLNEENKEWCSNFGWSFIKKQRKTYDNMLDRESQEEHNRLFGINLK